MSKIKLTFFGNFVMLLALIFSTILTFFVGLICKELEGGEEGKLMFYTMLVIMLLQIPTIIFLYSRLSKTRDYFVTENEIIQNNIVICKRKDIISIKRINFLKTEIRYLFNGAELVVFVHASKKKIEETKRLLGIFD